MQEKIELWFSDFPNQKKTKIILTALIIAIISGFFLLFLLTPNTIAQDAADITAQELIYLTNQERVARQLTGLSLNPKLTQAAENKVADLFKNQYFSHNSPAGKKFSSWVSELEYPYLVVGENLAMGFGDSQTIIRAWMNSEKHRENILMPRYQEIGMAVAKGKFEGKAVMMVVQYFGTTDIKKVSEALFPYHHSTNKTLNLLSKI